MGYKVGGGGGSDRPVACGWFWWKKTCNWIETGINNGVDPEEWYIDYPFGERVRMQYKCTTCGKLEWR